MGREVKKVDKDFDWPVGETWFGYELPSIQCQKCWTQPDEQENCGSCWHEGVLGVTAEPPLGQWYQMWETTSEGSPISPPFETAEELAHWLVDNNASSFGSMTATYESWLGMIQGGGYAPSAIISDGRLMSGVEGISEKA